MHQLHSSVNRLLRHFVTALSSQEARGALRCRFLLLASCVQRWCFQEDSVPRPCHDSEAIILGIDPKRGVGVQWCHPSPRNRKYKNHSTKEAQDA